MLSKCLCLDTFVWTLITHNMLLVEQLRSTVLGTVCPHGSHLTKKIFMCAFQWVTTTSGCSPVHYFSSTSLGFTSLRRCEGSTTGGEGGCKMGYLVYCGLYFVWAKLYAVCYVVVAAATDYPHGSGGKGRTLERGRGCFSGFLSRGQVSTAAAYFSTSKG